MREEQAAEQSTAGSTSDDDDDIDESAMTPEGMVRACEVAVARAELTFGLRVGEIRGVEMGAMWGRRAKAEAGQGYATILGEWGCIKCGGREGIQHIILGECMGGSAAEALKDMQAALDA